ncbi:MAG: asparagine synthetase B [Archaeoglobus sp.]|nr:asparagine synthetase B [Archaeoglobus sp.]
MSIYAFAEMEGGRAKHIYANCRYPSRQEGNIFLDFDGEVSLKYADELPIRLRDFYALVAIRPSHILASRDVFGGKPLYYNPFELSFSSFKSYFESECVELLPGEVLKLDYNGDVIERKRYTFEDVFSFDSEVGEEEFKERFYSILKNFKAKGCIAFSGGIDSSLLASIYDLDLVSVTANDKEEEWLRACGKLLGKDVEIKRFGKTEVEEVLPKLISTIESTDALQVSIALPIYLVMEFSRNLGYTSIVFGQGADELFGGYMRYATMDRRELRDSLVEDVRSIGIKNLVRDTKIAYSFETKLVAPYLQWDLIELALRLPVELKVRKLNGEVVRKYILRKIALDLLPKEIVKREKKAIQYSTGASEILKKLARSEGMKVQDYLRKFGVK